MGQDYSTFKTIFDTLTLPYQKQIDRELARHSKALEFLYKPVESTDGKPVNGIPTFEGRYVKMAINAEYPVTYSNLNQFNMQHGDVKQPKKAKNLLYAEISAVDKAFTMGIYTSDLQQLKTKGADRNKMIYVNWIEDFWKSYMKGFALHMCNSIYNGAGDTAIDADGNVKPDFIGLNAIGGILNSTAYGTKSSADFYEWQAHMWDLGGATTASRLGFAAADVDTVAELVVPASSYKTSRFYNVINRSRQQIEEISGERIICIMSPAQYDFLWLPALEANQINSASRLSINGNALEVKDDISKLGSLEIYRENSRLPISESGGGVKYVMDNNYIFFINPSYLNLEVESSNNFIVSDWQEIPNQYNTLQKSMTSTMLFYATKRFNMGKLKLPAAVAAELDTYYSL
jgi:hypothetical protein